MSLHALRAGQYVKVGAAMFRIMQRVPDARWQLQNVVTGEWCVFGESDLLDQFSRNELSFVVTIDECTRSGSRMSEKLSRDLSLYPSHLVELARIRIQYLREIDRQQPISITQATVEPLTRVVAGRFNDSKPPGWRTVCRDYRKWVSAGRDIRAIILRHTDKGRRGPRMVPDVKSISDQVIQELYMTAERKRVPEVHLEIVRRLSNENRFRPQAERLPIPSRSTIYREIERIPVYEVIAARYGKRRAEMEFRVSGIGPATSRALQRVSMDHTPSDIIVVDDNTMLPLGRPTITSALDEHTRCPMGFYMSFEPPSCLSVMRCLKHAILPKTYVPREFPSIKNSWECYGVPELVVVDNPPEFHSIHFERACRTSRVMLHKWIIDVYLQTPHRGVKDTPAHRWHSDVNALPPPLPPSASELEVVLGMTAQRVVFHYGVELEGLKFNGEELGALRRRMGTGAKVELTFDPGDLGHINVLDPQQGKYVRVPALDQAYAKGLSLWQHRVIRRYAQRRLNARTDIVALAHAKAEIRALVERDFNRKSTHGRKRHARFLEDHTSGSAAAVATRPAPNGNPGDSEVLAVSTIGTGEGEPMLAEASLASAEARPDAFTDDEVLPAFEASLDLPHVSAGTADEAPETQQAE